MFAVMAQSPHTPRLRVPAFHPVPIRTRSDGWTPVRQAEFIGVLAETGSVSAAAEFVGMARETAYRLRRKPGAEEFAHAWDVALAIAGVLRSDKLSRTTESRKVTGGPTWRMICDGHWRPVLRRGKYAGSVHKPDDSALLSYLAQIDRSFRAGQKELRKELRSQAQKARSVSGPNRPAAAPARPCPRRRGTARVPASRP